MKKEIILLAMILNWASALAQNSQSDKSVADIKKIYIDMSKYTDSLFQHTKLLNQCTSGIMFVRFNISKNGSLTDIQSNDGSPDFIDIVIKAALKKVKLSRGSSAKSEYVLPILYSLNINCKPDTGNAMHPMANLLSKIPDSTEPLKDGWVYSFKNMLNFKKTKEIPNSVSFIPKSYTFLPVLELKPAVY